MHRVKRIKVEHTKTGTKMYFTDSDKVAVALKSTRSAVNKVLITGGTINQTYKLSYE